MTLLHADNMFDGLWETKWRMIGTLTNVTTSTSGRHATGPNGSLEMKNTGSVVYDLPLATGDSVFLGTGLRMQSTQGGNSNLQARDGSDGLLLSVNYRPAQGALELRQGGSSGTLLDSLAIEPGSDWRHVVLEVSATAGEARVYYNGELACQATGLTLADVASMGVSGNVNSVGSIRHVVFQDTWVATANLGDARVIPVRPDGVGVADEWDPDDGTSPNWGRVADLPADPDTWVETDTNGARDSHAMANVFRDGDRPDVMGVVAYARGTKTDGVNRELSAGLRVGATNYDGDLAAIDGPTLARRLFVEDPSTSAPWDLDDVDVVEITYVAAKP